MTMCHVHSEWQSEAGGMIGASQPIQRVAMWLFQLIREEGSQSLVEVCCLFGLTTCGRHQEGNNGDMLDFPHLSYAHIFSHSCFAKHLSRLVLQFEGTNGLNTLTSNVLSHLPPQKPLAVMSNLAPSVVLALHPDMVSVVVSCNSGSTWTSLHTSDNKVGSGL